MSKPVYSLPQVIEQLRINWGGTFDQGEHRDWSDEQEVTYRINSNNKMDAHQVTMARMAYELWDDLVAISLREVSSGDGEVSFAYSDSESFAITYTDEELFGTHLDDADSRFSTKSNTLASANIQFGKYGFETYLHEIGHALGLTHPGQYDELDSSGSDLRGRRQPRPGHAAVHNHVVLRRGQGRQRRRLRQLIPGGPDAA